MAEGFYIQQLDIDDIRQVIQEELSKIQTSSPTAQLIDAEKVCQLLKITKQTLHNYVNKGLIFPIKLSAGVVRYDYEELMEFIQSRKVNSNG